jgi:hypothetical protein
LDWVNRVLISLDFKYKRIETPIVVFLLGGMSLSFVSFVETRRIAVKFGKSVFKANLIFVKQVVRFLLNKLTRVN